MPEVSAATNEARESAATLGSLRRLLEVVITFVWFGAVLFVGAGRLDWLRGWIALVVTMATFTVMGVFVQVYNKSVMAARAKFSRKGTKSFDKVFMAFFLPLYLVQPALAGMDAVRYHWSSLPFAFVYIGAIVFVLACLLITWVLVMNPFAESSVRIQNDRGHTVISAGPYRFVRHPMYVGMLLMFFASPLMWGSLWALAISGFLGVLLIWRTAREDATLLAELPGYRDYAAVTRYRLLPGIW